VRRYRAASSLEVFARRIDASFRGPLRRGPSAHIIRSNGFGKIICGAGFVAGTRLQQAHQWN
jgi:hypothetical protein